MKNKHSFLSFAPTLDGLALGIHYGKECVGFSQYAVKLVRDTFKHQAFLYTAKECSANAYAFDTQIPLDMELAGEWQNCMLFTRFNFDAQPLDGGTKLFAININTTQIEMYDYQTTTISDSHFAITDGSGKNVSLNFCLTSR